MMVWVKRAAIAAICLAGLVVGLDRLFPPPLERAGNVSTLVSDRDGKPLRAIPLSDGTWRFAADLDAIDPVFIEALLAVEDKRFWSHGGVDWVGMARAALSSARAGHIVSGGSTITMQTARLLEPRPRTIGSKLIEMLRAHQIEARLSKREILELYLTLTPYGGNLEGLRAASWRYFGRAPDRLSDDQIALLIALPQSPEMRRPDRRAEGARRGRAAIAAKLERLGFLSPQRAGEVRTAALPETWQSFPARAWQASARAARGARGDVHSTLDMGLQSDLQRLALRAATDAGPDVQVAILVVETRTRAVRAAIGSASRERPGGWLDLTAQPRSPGSTLKPFIYALAFDDGHAGPATRIADLPKRFAAYQPENFDRLFRGDVRVAEALQHSLNIPAVLALDRVGAERFAASLALAGAAPRLPARADGTPGLALALGGAGMTAQELAILYAALGDNGVVRPLIWNEDAIDESLERPGYRLMGAQTAKSIRAILEATPTPAGRMPARLTANAPQIAFKTGTSYGFRDAWAAGVSDGHAIIVWVGRADGAPRPGETGRRAALPLLFEVADRALLHLGGAGPAESRLVQSSLPEARGGLSQFQTDNAPPEILFPPRGTELWAGSTNGQSARPFVFAGQGQGRLSWFVDGQPIARDDGGLPAWRPMAAGFYRVSAVDEAGRESAVSVRVLMED